ncbi:MAG: class I SAM-dependent methyltransferase [Geobacter sp.]|nr:MAG: class I SAM-dependent methyltransferase [Geobacter sp.]
MVFPGGLLNKNITNLVNKAFELFLPPILSDRKFVAIFFNFLQGRGFRYYDATTNPVAVPRCHRSSDCSRRILIKAMDLVVGRKVLDIGCGSGSFIKQLAKNGYHCTGIDPNQNEERGDNWQILKGFVEDYEFSENTFDTVVSFKTLEHIPDAKSALQSWRKLANHRIILILPCQRYRRYVYDGHINFYPDEFQLRLQLGLSIKAKIEKINFEWLVYEDIHIE